MPLLVNQGRVFALVFLLLLSAKTSLAQKGPRGFNQLFDSTSWSSNTGVRLNPQAISFVEGYMQRYGPGLRKMKGWGLPYFNMMDQVLAENGLPGSSCPPLEKGTD